MNNKKVTRKEMIDYCVKAIIKRSAWNGELIKVEEACRYYSTFNDKGIEKRYRYYKMLQE